MLLGDTFSKTYNKLHKKGDALIARENYPRFKLPLPARTSLSSHPLQFKAARKPNLLNPSIVANRAQIERGTDCSAGCNYRHHRGSDAWTQPIRCRR